MKTLTKATLLAAGVSLTAYAVDFNAEQLKWTQDNYRVDRAKAQQDPSVALQKLIGGNRRFVENKSVRPRADASTLKQLETSQSPFAVVVGCSDSRVPNEIVFDQGLGDLFIVRTAGQVSSAASYGSIEFATTALQTRLVLVLGHTECGAVAAAVKRPKDVTGHIVTLINEIKPSVARCAGKPGDPTENAVRQNVIDQVANLRDLEPTLSEKYRKGELWIVGGVYDIRTGKVEFLKETLTGLPEPVRTASKLAK